MTDTTARPLTALDHVEKIAQHYDSDIEGCDPECAATLRALAARVAELDAARAEVARLRGLMPEVIASLDAGGQDVSLVRDLRAAMQEGSVVAQFWTPDE